MSGAKKSSISTVPMQTAESGTDQEISSAQYLSSASVQQTDVQQSDTRRIARKRRSMYDIFAVSFVAFLLLSNIGATKLIAVGPLVFDGGAILFPLTYIIGDVLSEVYGFARARRAIVMGFVISIISSLVFFLIIQAPPVDLAYQEKFAAVLGVVPRFVAASLFGYLVGQLLNSYVLVRIKAKFGERQMWARLLGSTVVGEFADTIIFCFIAWVGVESIATIVNLTVVGFIYKVGVEFVLLPVTYAVIGWVKRHEIEYK